MSSQAERLAQSPGRRPQKKLRRAEKAMENRRALLRAASKVVARYGYAEASVARITQEAGLAQGTFYLYYNTRQDLLDEVLPFTGEQLSDFIRQRVKGAEDAFDVEELSFRAAFDYLQRNPGFYRMLNEAEFSAPRGFKAQFDNAASRYLASLKRSKDRGELRGYEPRELEVLAYILMGIRFYIYLRFVKAEAGKTLRLPDWVVKTYMKFIRNGLDAESHRMNGRSSVARVAGAARGRQAIHARRARGSDND